jgi:DnaB-like helicase N terminal domain/AAA domain
MATPVIPRAFSEGLAIPKGTMAHGHEGPEVGARQPDGRRSTPDSPVPHDLDAEKCVLGAILINNAKIRDVASIVGPADFFRRAHRVIFEQMLALDNEGTPIDPVTLKSHMGTRLLDDAGGFAYITSLTDGLPRTVNAESYAGIVKEQSALRQLIDHAEDIRRLAYGNDLAGAVAALHEGTARLYAPVGESSLLRGQVDRERAYREARRLVDAEERGPIVWPEMLTLNQRLARPRQPKAYRIEGWQPENTRVMLAAQFKAGKTTLRDNYVRSIVDGDRFLDRYAVVAVTGKVAILDTELHPDMLDQWLDDQRIQFPERVVPIPFKNALSGLNFLDRVVRSELAARLREQGVVLVILDNLRPVMDSLGLDENRDAGRLLVAFDQFLAELGADEAMVITHMGHSGERARGDSRLRDWPDVEWRLVREDNDPRSPRYISAYGRDVDVQEHQLGYVAQTRRLTFAGGSRKDARALDALEVVRDVLAGADQPMSGRQIKKKLEGIGKDTADAALRLGVKNQKLLMGPGKGGAKLYSLPVSDRP